MESSRQIEDRAHAWLAQRDSGRWSEADQEAFATWLRADTAHRVTFLRVEVAWERSARLKAIGAGRQPGVVPPPGQWRTSPFFERRPAPTVRSALRRSTWRISAAAAGMLLAVGVGFCLKTFLSGPGNNYSTPIGGVASIPLGDGSKMTLNTDRKVRVALTEKERRIELQTGEAFFDVAKDPSRPFIVEAGDKRITAIGTAFSVRRDGKKVQVVVTEGKVRVEDREGRVQEELLAAGTVLRTAHDSQLVQKATPQKAAEALSWRSGYLTFDETSLADAVAEFNRYQTQRIVIEDPKLAALRINGKFRSTNAEDFVQLLEDGFGIAVTRTGQTINLASQ